MQECFSFLTFPNNHNNCLFSFVYSINRELFSSGSKQWQNDWVIGQELLDCLNTNNMIIGYQLKARTKTDLATLVHHRTIEACKKYINSQQNRPKKVHQRLRWRCWLIWAMCVVCMFQIYSHILVDQSYSKSYATDTIEIFWTIFFLYMF